MEANEILIIAMLVSFIFCLFLGFPVAWSLAGVGILFAGAGYWADMTLDTMTGMDYQMLGLLSGRIFAIMDNWLLVAIPLFIFMGLIMEKSGIAERLMQSMQQLFGRVHGGLAITVVLIGIILAASTGIIGASVVLLGLMSLPVMLEQGYARPIALGTVASAGSLGILIPPSIMLVMMGDQLAISVGDLFMGAVFPGLLLGSAYVLFIFVTGRLRPANMPLPDSVEPLRSSIMIELLWKLLPPLFLMLSVLGSIFAGIATVTEAAGVGAAGALLLAWVYRKLNYAVLKETLVSSFSTTGYIFAIFIGATVFSLVLRELGGDEFIAGLFPDATDQAVWTLFLILAVIFILGFFLDWIEITLIVLPLFAPMVSNMDLAVLQSHTMEDGQLIWFALLVAITLQTSFLTPPVGFALFYLKGICPKDISLSDIYRGVWPFVLIQLFVLAVVAVFPALVLWLPSVSY